MQFRQSAHEGQAKAEAAARAVQPRFRLLENVEDVGKHLRIDADARIGDINRRDAAFRVEADLHRNRAARRGKFVGIVKQVPDHLHEARGIALHPQRRVGQAELDRQLAFLDNNAVIVDRLPHEAHDIAALLAQQHLPAREARGIEQIVDEARHMRHLPVDDVAQLPVARRVRLPFAAAD